MAAANCDFTASSTPKGGYVLNDSLPLAVASGNAEADAAYIKGKTMMNEAKYAEMKLLFLQAIALGQVSAMNDLAYYHQYVEKDAANVVKYYSMAAAKGNMGSAYNLGFFYHEQKDLVNHKKWWQLASENGNDNATFGLGVMAEDSHEYKVAEGYFRLSKSRGNTKAIRALADCLLEQEQVQEAKDMYLEALRNGDKAASYCFDDQRLGSLSAEERKESFLLIAKFHGMTTDRLKALAKTCRGNLADSLLLPGCTRYPIREVLTTILAS